MNHSSLYSRPLDDIDVRAEETEDGVAHGDRIEVGTFAEGEYVESILLDRARALEIYRDLGEILGDRFTSERETATILAALRYWQREGSLSAGHERDIETDLDRLEPLSAGEIDALCERLNCRDDDRLKG
jgi:hypothetical protein